MCLIEGEVKMPQGDHSAKVWMTRLHCDKTTEAGEDEVYLIVAGKWNDGGTFVKRLPEGEGRDHWDLNDNGANKREVDHVVGFGTYEFRPGHCLDLTITVMEQDSGTSKPWQDLGVFIIGLWGVANGDGGKAGSVADSVNGCLGTLLEDPDDCLGSFRIRMWNDRGTMRRKIWTDARPQGFDERKFTVDLTGAGSRYQATFVNPVDDDNRPERD